RPARDEGRLERELAQIGRAELLVVDELGFLPLDADGARLLFQVVSASSEPQSVVFTTNLDFSRWCYQVISERYEGGRVVFTTKGGFSRWGTVFAEDKLAAAIVDRVVQHGRLVEFGGPSHRREESLRLGKSGR
ncbi:MAG: ATP-binding protein, partial [Olsenella umbonata]|nr:ATP-binding protein [Parafannyhessea umbonata]